MLGCNDDYSSCVTALNGMLVIGSHNVYGGLQIIDFIKDTVGGIDVNMFEHFFQSLCNHAFLTLHIENFTGDNTHHQIETIFKAFGRALRMALEIDSRQGDEIPSTKGSL